ncbi:MAG: alginate export family protein [Candidatus Omnitrophica bacterium]|nr:alginate export family protein [Candidatus Omnitrophota bacterium]
MRNGIVLWIILCGLTVAAAPSFAQEASGGRFQQWRTALSAEERFRYEYRHDFDFNKDIKDAGSQFYQRLRFGFDACLTDEYLDPKLDIFIEGLDAQTGGYRINANSGQTDDFDLHQAFVNFMNIWGSGFDFKAGRQEFKYGKGRLVAAPTWANRIRSFDGGVIRYRREAFYADILYGQDVKYNDNNLNVSSHVESLTGVYAGYKAQKTALTTEGYFLSQDVTSTSPRTRRYTLGLRLYGRALGLDYDMEAPYQFGRTQNRDISAYAFHLDVSRTFGEIAWKPQLAISYDEASGDKKAGDGTTNTFNPLYQSTHDPYGLLDFFRWQNMRNPEISLTLAPTEKLKVRPQVDVFWLQNTNDAWYNSSGAVVRTKTSGDRSSYVGTEASLRVFYDFGKHVKAECGYAHFFCGGYVKATGAHDDVDWVYSQITLKI